MRGFGRGGGQGTGHAALRPPPPPSPLNSTAPSSAQGPARPGVELRPRRERAKRPSVRSGRTDVGGRGRGATAAVLREDRDGPFGRAPPSVGLPGAQGRCAAEGVAREGGREA